MKHGQRQRGLGISGALILLLLGTIAGITIDNAVSLPMWDQAVHASVPCRVEDGMGGSVAGVGFNTGSELDEGCAAREASRLSPDEQRQEFVWCSLASNIRTFGSVRNCLNYNGNNDAIIAQVEQRVSYCRSKSKKLRYRVTLRRNKVYERCMDQYT